MSKMTRTLPTFALAGSLLLTACPAGGSSTSGGADFQMSRGFRTINVTAAGTYGPVDLTAPALTAQEIRINADAPVIKEYSLTITNEQGSVDAYACSDAPCSGFSTTSDWKDLSDDSTKGISVTLNNSKPTFFYAFNRTRSPKSYRLVLIAKAR